MLKGHKDLLIEIGVEELPVSYIRPALNSWLDYLDGKLKDLKLHAAAKKVAVKYSTPRRLTLYIKGIKIKQDDEVLEKIGPAARVAFDDEGELSKAGKGFLRGAKVDSADLNFPRIKDNLAGGSDPYIKQTEKGEYIAVKQEIKGKQASELLARECKESLAKINFPKMMRWKSKNFRFARPIRWILALYGDDVLNFEAAGVKSNNITYGNLLEKKADPLEINRIEDYVPLLKDKWVIADREERKTNISQQLEKEAAKINGIVSDKRLLEEVTDIVEYPTAVLAEYRLSYLELPARVIHSTLTTNQRYFPIYKKEDSRLMNNFVYVANNHPDYARNTKEGNERVVKARLADAGFYFKEDKAKSIDYFNNKLEGIVFHVKLGSIKDKVERIVKISDYLCEQIGVDKPHKKKILRAASICKFDLATAMVGEKEFTGLQGYMGKEYALVWGEDEDVAQAVEEHYLPVGLGVFPEISITDTFEKIYNLRSEDIPSLTGSMVSLADKIDTLCGFFGIGVIPTGSKDQYALRRAGNSVVKLINEAKLSLSLEGLIELAYSLLNDKFPATNNYKDKLWKFFQKRIEQYLQYLHIDYDVINAVTAINFDEIVKVISRAAALQSIRERDDFEHLMLSFKRVTNIIAAEKGFPGIDISLFKEEGERILYDSINNTGKRVSSLLKEDDYRQVLEEFIGLNEVIDAFFDNVLVNVEDDKIRRNRYALLNMLRDLFLNIGDLSLIVIEGDN